MEDLIDIDKCSSISELVKDVPEEVEKKFESIYEASEQNTKYADAKVITNKTAVITPTVRKAHLVDYGSSESEESEEVPTSDVMKTPHPLARKATKLRQRTATPHVKKLLKLIKQNAEVEEIEEIGEEDIDKTTPKNTIGE